jgi:hypothetical protein
MVLLEGVHWKRSPGLGSLVGVPRRWSREAGPRIGVSGGSFLDIVPLEGSALDVVTWGCPVEVVPEVIPGWVHLDCFPRWVPFSLSPEGGPHEDVPRGVPHSVPT